MSERDPRASEKDRDATDTGEHPDRGDAGEGPETRRIRGKPGTETAKVRERERDRTGADTRRASTAPDPDAQTDSSGLEKKLEHPDERNRDEPADAGATGSSGAESRSGAESVPATDDRKESGADQDR